MATLFCAQRSFINFFLLLFDIGANIKGCHGRNIDENILCYFFQYYSEKKMAMPESDCCAGCVMVIIGAKLPCFNTFLLNATMLGSVTVKMSQTL